MKHRKSKLFLLVLAFSVALAPSFAGVIFIPPDPPPELNRPGGTLRLAAGPNSFLDVLGRTWISDAPYLVTTGTNIAFFTDEFAFIDVSLLSDPDTPPFVFRTERWKDGDIRHEIPVFTATYKVYILLAEMCGGCVSPAMGGFANCGSCARIMDIQVENQRINAYNQADAALGAPNDGLGATWKATELVFNVRVTDGTLNISHVDRGGGNPPENAAVKGIVIVRLPEELETPGGTFHVNAGVKSFADAIGRTWHADDVFVRTPGTLTTTTTTPSFGGFLQDVHVPIDVLKDERTLNGDFRYAVAVRNGVYAARLYFSEICRDCVGIRYLGTGPAAGDRRFNVRVEDKEVFDFSPPDAGVPPSRDGSGRTFSASELGFFTSVDDHLVNIELRDLGPGNPPLNPTLSALALTRLDASVLTTTAPLVVGLHSLKREALVLIEADKPVVVTAESQGEVSLFVRWQGIPTPGEHDDAAALVNGRACLATPVRSGGCSLLLLRADKLVDGLATVRLTVTPRSYALKSFSPSQAAPDGNGKISAVIEGTNLGQQMILVLRRHGGSRELPALEYHVPSSTRAEVVFDASGAPAGLYDLHARWLGPTFGRVPPEATLDSAFTLLSPSTGPIVSFRLDGFGAYRRNELSRVTLRYRNEGDSEVLAPLFKIEGPAGIELGLRLDESLETGPLQVLGVDEDGIAGTLSPGERWHEVHVYFRSAAANRVELKVSIFTPTESDALDWDVMPAPRGLTPAQWQTLRARLRERVGTTWRAYHEALARTASRLHRRGEDTTDVQTLFRFVAREVQDMFTSSVSGQMLDIASGAPVKSARVVARRGIISAAFATTDDDGFFSIDWLRPGLTYTLGVVDWQIPAQEVVVTTGDSFGLQLVGSRGISGFNAGCSNCRDGELPTGTVTPPASLFAGTRGHLLDELRSLDPNEKSGPRKAGMVGSENVICPDDTIEYQIRFENIPDPGAGGGGPARRIILRDQLDDAVFDLTTFRFTEVILPGANYPLTTLEQNNVYTTAAGTYGSSETVEGVGTLGIVCVSVQGNFDAATGLIELVLQAVEPGSDVLIPPFDPTLGILLSGEHGSFSFTVEADNGIDEGTEIKNHGEIIFDDNEPIMTNETSHVFSDCLPTVPHGPVPADRTDRSAGREIVLGWSSKHADTYDVFLGRAGTQRTRIATAIVEQGFRPTGLASSQVYEWQVRARNARGTVDGPVWRFLTGSPAGSFLRGDANADGRKDISDAVAILAYLFLGGSSIQCEKSLDVDDDGKVIVTDPVFLLNHLFLGSRSPPPPFAACGMDPTVDGLLCPAHGGCG